MLNRIDKKPFGQVKKGDTIYSITYYQATVVIYKLEVTDNPVSLNHNISVKINFGKKYHICVCKESSCYFERYQFGKWVVTTTLEEAKEICREMTENKIKEHKKAIEAAKQKIKKWEQFKSRLNNDLYIIKQNGE